MSDLIPNTTNQIKQETCSYQNNNINSNNTTKDSIFLSKDSSFGEHTLSLMQNNNTHKTKVLDIAESYLGKIMEVTDEELMSLPYFHNGTQVEIIGKNGSPNHPWCAHTVSFMCERAGMNINGHKASVRKFIEWGEQNNYYNSIKTNNINPTNYLQEREQREKQIKTQINNMNEGDLIIWKSDTIYKTQIGLQSGCASHIGILESVNPDGSITVIEGNANESKSDEKYERYVVTNHEEALLGNQKIGEFQEVNPRDGIIRKVYTPKELAANGYSGYINMQEIVK